MATALLVSGCFWDNRSAGAVCHVWDTDGLALHNHLEVNQSHAQQNPIAALAQVAAAPGEVGDLMAKMAAVAPSDVEPSFQQLAEAFHQVGQNEGTAAVNPLAGLANGLANAFAAQGAADNVNQFLAHNCGIPK